MWEIRSYNDTIKTLHQKQKEGLLDTFSLKKKKKNFYIADITIKKDGKNIRIIMHKFIPIITSPGGVI